MFALAAFGIGDKSFPPTPIPWGYVIIVTGMLLCLLTSIYARRNNATEQARWLLRIASLVFAAAGVAMIVLTVVSVIRIWELLGSVDSPWDWLAREMLWKVVVVTAVAITAVVNLLLLRRKKGSSKSVSA